MDKESKRGGSVLRGVGGHGDPQSVRQLQGEQ